MRIAFLGFGLISGSVARSLRAEGGRTHHLTAWSPSGSGPRRALAEAVLDRAADRPQDALEGAELIVLGGPAPACLTLLDDLAGPWRTALAPDHVVTDVASTKSALVLRATALGVRFVGGHPMAGRETSGYGAATTDLFRDRPWIVVPSTDEAAVTRVEGLAREVGARPVRMSAETHDQAVAGISQLPLVAAASLVASVAGSVAAPAAGWGEARSLAATGWRDMTRLARGDVEMGAGMLTTNAPAIAGRLRAYIEELTAWAEALERSGGADADELERRLAAARAVLEASDG